jgi:hypothetical protein
MGAVVVRPAAVAAPLWQKVPFKMPANALVPHKVAERILQAYRDSHQGAPDL